MEIQSVIGRAVPSPRALLAYALALALIALAVLATLGMRALSPVYLTFFAFYVAIFVAGWYGGYGSGLLAALLAVLAVNAFFLPPVFSFTPMRDHLPRLAAFVICAVIAAAISARQRRAHEALREARDSLEERVRQRTRELIDSRQRLAVQMAARDRAVEALRLILDVTEAASAAPTAAAAGACLEKICRLKELPFGQAWFRDEQQDRLACSAKAVYGAEALPALRAASLGKPLAKGIGLPGRVWETGGAIWSRFDEISVTENHVVRQRGPSGEYLAQGALTWEERAPVPMSPDLFPRAQAVQGGVGSGVAFPIFLGDKLLAVLEFFVGESRPLDEAFLDAVDKLGRVLGDVLERKRAEEAQRASEERWRRVFESSAIPMALADGNRRIIAANAACERLLGYTPEEFLTLSALDFKYGDDRDVSARMLSELEQGLRREFQGELRFRCKDGTPIWVNVSVSYVPATEVTPALFPAVIEDVTQRKVAELERRRLASIVEQARDFMGIADLHGTPIYLNEVGLKMVGLDNLEGARSRRGTHYLFGEDRPFVNQVVWPAVMQKGSWSGEFRLRHFKTGRAIPVLYDAFRIDDPETGQPTNVGYACRDITSRKRAEDALRASEERWRMVFETSLVGITTSDDSRRYTSANRAFQAMVGYSEAELRAMQPIDLTHEDDRAESGQLIDDLLAGRRHSYQVEKRYRRKDGEAIWVDVYCSHVPGSESMPGFYQAVIIDITERKRAEAALRASLARWRTVFATASVGIALSDAARRILSANAALQRMLGYSEAELCALGWGELTHDDDQALTQNWVTDLEQGRQQSYQVEKRYRRKDGGYIWVNVNASYVPAIDAAPAFFVSMVVDIDERKRAEQALRASEERWRRLFDTSSAGIALVEVRGRYVTANPAFQRMLGYTEAELQALTPVEISHEDDRAQTEAVIAEFARHERQAYYVEKRYLRSDGRPVWVSISTSYVSGSDDAPPLLLGIYVDISERKQAEAALRASEERWRRVFEHSPTGIAMVGADRRLTAANPACQRMLGYDEVELREMTPLDFSFEDDWDLTRSLLGQLLEGKQQAVRVEKRYRRSDGEVIWGDASLFRVPATEDTPAFVTAIVVDITERKRAEESLRASEARWRSIFEHAVIGVGTIGPDWRFLSTNPAFQKMIGYTEKELRTLTPVDITHEDDHEATEQILGAAWKGGQGNDYSMEKRYVRKDGRIIWANLSGAPVPAQGKNPAFFPAIVIDITDRKRAEEGLRKTQADLARVTRVTTMGELTASIAHEINQPLSAIVASGNACRRWLASAPPNIARARDSVERMIGDANRASEIIMHIRSLTKKSPAVQRALNINDVVDDVLALTRGELLAKQISLRTELDADLPSIVGDRVQLQQVVLNLVMNAVEAMVAMMDRRHILAITSRLGGGNVLVTVQDTGTGLDPATAERIFDAFLPRNPKAWAWDCRSAPRLSRRMAGTFGRRRRLHMAPRFISACRRRRPRAALSRIRRSR